MSDSQNKSGSVKSSEYSGTSDSVKTANEQIHISPKDAELAVSSGNHTKRDREVRKEAREGKTK